MARNLGSLTVDLVLKLGGFKQGSDAAQREVDKLNRQISQRLRGITSSFRSLGGIIGTALGGFSVAQIVQATAEAEQSFALLTQAVENNGGAAGRTAEQLSEIATQLQHVSTFSDEAIQDAQALLLAFNSIRGDNFDRATQSVLDLATRLGKDLPSAALLVGKALEDPIKGMRQLARSGVVFSAEQRKVIKDLVDTGQAAEAQGILLSALEAKFKGTAAAARDNFGGALKGLKEDFANLLEAKGGLPDATKSINDFSKVLQDPGTKQGADAITSTLLKFGGIVVQALAGAANGLITIQDHLETAKTLATQGIDFPVHLDADELATEIKRLEERLVLQRKTTRLLIPTFLERLETAELERQLARLRSLRVEIPVQFKSLASTLNLPESVKSPLSDEEISQLEKIADAGKSVTEKLREAREELERLQERAKGTDLEFDDVTLEKRLTELKATIEKPVKSAGLSKAQQEITTAKEAVASFVERIEAQRAMLGQGEEASLRFSVTQGDVAKAIKVAGDAAGYTTPQILSLVDALERDSATKSIEEQITALRDQTAVIGLSEQQAFAYSVTQGDLAKVLDKTGEAGERLRVILLQANNEQAAAQRELAAAGERATIFEATRTDAERYAATLEHLRELYREGDQETYGRAVADAAAEMVDASSAGEAYRKTLAELQRQLDASEISQAAFAAGSAEAARDLAAAQKEADKAFRDEAQRGTQRVVADVLKDPFSKSISEIGQDLDEMFRTAAANALSVKLAENLFNGFDEWFSKIGDFLASLFKQAGGLGGAAGGGGGGGFWSGLKSIFGFSEGGYTGPGHRLQPAGIVHAGEGVLSQDDVRALGGPAGFEALLDAIRHGYDRGGLVRAPGTPAAQALRRPPDAPWVSHGRSTVWLDAEEAERALAGLVRGLADTLLLRPATSPALADRGGVLEGRPTVAAIFDLGLMAANISQGRLMVSGSGRGPADGLSQFLRAAQPPEMVRSGRLADGSAPTRPVAPGATSETAELRHFSVGLEPLELGEFPLMVRHIAEGLVRVPDIVRAVREGAGHFRGPPEGPAQWRTAPAVPGQPGESLESLSRLEKSLISRHSVDRVWPGQVADSRVMAADMAAVRLMVPDSLREVADGAGQWRSGPEGIEQFRTVAEGPSIALAAVPSLASRVVLSIGQGGGSLDQAWGRLAESGRAVVPSIGGSPGSVAGRQGGGPLDWGSLPLPLAAAPRPGHPVLLGANGPQILFAKDGPVRILPLESSTSVMSDRLRESIERTVPGLAAPFAGMFADGGVIPGGHFGVVGEGGLEAAMSDGRNWSGSGGGVTVNQNFYFDAPTGQVSQSTRQQVAAAAARGVARAGARNN